LTNILFHHKGHWRSQYLQMEANSCILSHFLNNNRAKLGVLWESVNSFEVNGTTTSWVCCIFSLCLSRLLSCAPLSAAASAARYLPLALLPFLTRNSLIYSPASDGVQDAAAGFVCTSFRDLHLSPRGRNDEISHFALCSTFAPAARREFENSPAQKFCFCDKWLFLFTSTFGPEWKDLWTFGGYF